MDQLVRSFLPPTRADSLDRLIAIVRKTKTATAVQVRNDPPRIFVSNKPAILVQVDGQPVLGQIRDTNLQFVVNTNWPLFFDKSHSNYYLFTGKRWLTSMNLSGSWSATATLPDEMSKLASDPQWAGLVPAITPPATDSGPAPAVFYSTGPAEIIVFDGPPSYTQLGGTRLSSHPILTPMFRLWSNTAVLYYCWPLVSSASFQDLDLRNIRLASDFANSEQPCSRVLSRCSH